MKLKTSFLALTVLPLLCATSHAADSHFEWGTAIQDIAKSNPAYTPVVVVHHPDGETEVLPIERVSPETDAKIHREEALPLLWLPLGEGDAFATLDLGAGYTNLQGGYASLGFCVGAVNGGILSAGRYGFLFEVAPGTNGLKAAAGISAGILPLANITLSAAYIRTYGSRIEVYNYEGQTTGIDPGSDLTGIEASVDLLMFHGILGAYQDLFKGNWVINVGGGIAF